MENEKKCVQGIGRFLYKALVGSHPDPSYFSKPEKDYNFRGVKFPNHLSVFAKTLLKSMLINDEEVRLNFGELLAQDWFRKYGLIDKSFLGKRQCFWAQFIHINVRFTSSDQLFDPYYS